MIATIVAIVVIAMIAMIAMIATLPVPVPVPLPEPEPLPLALARAREDARGRWYPKPKCGTLHLGVTGPALLHVLLHARASDGSPVSPSSCTPDALPPHQLASRDPLLAHPRSLGYSPLRA